MGDGRLGLALSGGGFRAAFFHLGVLAQMARHSLLHQVEVISTVSGGSVIGALYYLHVRNLLQARPDAEITPADYEVLVDTMAGQFLDAVQRNLRTRTFTNPRKSMRMGLDPRYSRSDRIGELYNRYFYAPVVGDGSLELRHLKIQPPDEDEEAGFYPRDDNVRRTNKVPMLRINTTALNTGRNWRFEAARMGEPPRTGPVEIDVDRNDRLCRPESYDVITDEQDDFPLGHAVAASTCVPGMFPPLAVSKLYPDVRVQLVDGGVHDNLGIASLLDLDCTRFVISDAGGQLTFLDEPSGGILGVLTRSNSILFNRVREEQLFGFTQRGLPHAFVHLRRGLPTRTIPYIATDGQPAVAACAPSGQAEQGDSSAEFGIDPRVQERLARVRTDLDSFSDVEAFTLAYDAYRMSEQPLGALAGEPPAGPERVWSFLAVADEARSPSPRFLHRLDVARRRFGKPLRLGSGAAVVAWAVLLAVVAVVVALARWAGLFTWVWHLPVPSFRLGPALVALAGIGLAVAVALWVFQRNEVGGALRRVSAAGIGLVRGLLLAVLAAFLWIHLSVLDRLFLADGRIRQE